MTAQPKFDPASVTDPAERDLLGLDPLPAKPAARPANLPRGAAADPTLLREKTRLAAEQADKIEIANARSRGELLPAAAVERQWAGILHDVRRAMLAVPARLTDVDRRIVERVDREIRDALEGLADAG